MLLCIPFGFSNINNSGLETVLQTGNLLQYPQVCAEATALFSVLSDSINAIRSTLQQHQDQESSGLCVGLITQLQNAEKNKLRLTAALHLERLRATSTETGDEKEQHDRIPISELQQRDIKSLQHGIAASVAEINECLEELRFAAMEDNDEE